MRARDYKLHQIVSCASVDGGPNERFPKKGYAKGRRGPAKGSDRLAENLLCVRGVAWWSRSRRPRAGAQIEPRRCARPIAYCVCAESIMVLAAQRSMQQKAAEWPR
jgi:hypothetical protein